MFTSIGVVSITPVGFQIAGESYTLECFAGGFMAVFEWMGPPDGRTPISSSITISSNSTLSLLQFRPLQQSHSGSYSCHAITNEGTPSSEPIEIRVNGNSYLTTVSTLYSVINNNYVALILQLPKYLFTSRRVLMVWFPLQERITILFAVYLELSSSILSSLISGERLVTILI